MAMALIILFITWIGQSYMLKPLTENLKKPTTSNSFFCIFISISTTLMGIFAFGPPYAPSLVTSFTLAVIFYIKTQLPELIAEL